MGLLSKIFRGCVPVPPIIIGSQSLPAQVNPPERFLDLKSISKLGIIAGNGVLPAQVAIEARRLGIATYAICHEGETQPELEGAVTKFNWIKVGQLGAIINFFRSAGITHAVMVGGVNRVKLFGGVKLDTRGAFLLARLRSGKDDVIMRGIAAELESEGIKMIEGTLLLQDLVVTEEILTRRGVTSEQLADIEVGIRALVAMSGQDIGQLVVVREGVVVAVEAVEGSDKAILRGGELGGHGSVVIKLSKPTQDMRFDVPTIGPQTIEMMSQVRASVLAVEANRCLILDRKETVDRAEKAGIAIVGCQTELSSSYSLLHQSAA